MRSGLARIPTFLVVIKPRMHSNTLVTPPDTRFSYSNANSQLFEPLLRRATGMDAHAYLTEKILRPIGIDPANVGLWLTIPAPNP